MDRLVLSLLFLTNALEEYWFLLCLRKKDKKRQSELNSAQNTHEKHLSTSYNNYIKEMEETIMEGIIGTLEFYAPALVLGVFVIGIIYFMKKRNDKK